MDFCFNSVMKNLEPSDVDNVLVYDMRYKLYHDYSI